MAACSFKGQPAGGKLSGDMGNFQQSEGIAGCEAFGWAQGKFCIGGEEIDLKGSALTVQGLLDLGFQTDAQDGYDIIGAPKILVFTRDDVTLEAAVISYQPCEFSEVKVFQIDSKGEMNPEFEVDGLKLGSTQKEVQERLGQPFRKSQQGENAVWSYLAEVDSSEQFQYRLDVSFQGQIVTALSYTVGENHLIQF